MVNPGFFKFYKPSLGELINTKIPRFSESVQGSWPATLTLRDRYSNLWPVKVELIGGAWHFRDGWTKFISDNMVEDGHCIIYEYSYKGLLDFKVFDGSACMTKGVGCHIKVDEDVAQDVSRERSEVGLRVGTTPAVNGGARTRKPKTTRDFDWFGSKLIKAGHIRQPDNPYFVTKNRSERGYELYVPTETIRGYSLELPDTISILDPEGREFRATLKTWRDGRKMYRGGWKSLCMVNKVGDEVSCICEFVQREQHLQIHVSFFRPQ